MDGGYWVIWEEDAARGRVDLMARQLDDKLEPKGKVTRLAQLASAPRNANTASSPDARRGARRAAGRAVGRPRRRAPSDHVAARGR